YVSELVQALIKELKMRSEYIQEPVSTIYFGGGTPSILSLAQLSNIFDAINTTYNVEVDAEITLESNPDDLSITYLSEIAQLPVNRLSIGIQSFDNDDLKRLNRRHTSIQAVEAVKNAQEAGFNNISIDLIYGLPLQTTEKWLKQVTKAFELNIQHISAYGLTYEKGTALWNQRYEGVVKEIEDDTMNEMYSEMLKSMKINDFIAYEISNFSKHGFQSRHNSSYWKFEPYLGIGPSAHSFDGASRQWNVSSISQYINALKNNRKYFDKEILTTNDRYNDYIMVSLRTAEGSDLNYIKSAFGHSYKTFFLKSLNSFLQSNHVEFRDNRYKLTENGIYISNLIISELMKV
ncbi:MAG TPA: radical SAM family heme chaperone HemW, partial [Paludibacter sp.]|nr:radical SAM family heme chaperone HemW [Paludibacter sp.]